MKKNAYSIKSRKGFTLVELLATLFIASLILGITTYYTINTINSSKNRANNISMRNLKDSAKLYIREYAENTVWEEKNSNEKTTCISIEELINSGYIKEKQLESIKDINSIVLTKNNNNNITKTELKETTCSGIHKIAIPTAKEYCNDISYNGTLQELTKPISSNSNFTFENNKGRTAGEYIVTAKLKDTNNYVWKDNSKTNKTLTCTIKKAIPNLTVNPLGTEGIVGQDQTVTITSNTPGKLTVRSTNKEHVTATLTSSNILTTQTMTVKTLSTRKATTYINVTLTPSDANFYTTTATYTVGEIERKVIEKPTDNLCKKNLIYNGSNQTLLTQTNITGYTFDKTQGKEVGTYKLTASLKYGYTWQDNTTKDVSINCSISKKIPTVSIISVTNPNNDKNILNATTSSAELMKTFDAIIKFDTNVPGTFIAKSLDTTSITIKSTNTNTVTINGKEVKATETKIQTTFTPTDTKNYTTITINYTITKVISNKFTIVYKTNKGSGTMTNTTATYGENTTISNNKYTRTGYHFLGWTTKSNETNDNFNWTNWSGKWQYGNGQKGIANNTLTLYARWEANNYTVAFSGNGHTAGKTDDAKCTYDKDCKLTKNGFIKQYTVSFNPNTGTISANGVNVTAYSATSAYTFTNWKNPNNATTYNDEATVKNLITEGKITLPAQWKTKAITLPTATKACYTLNGWYDAGNNKIGNAGASYTPNANTSLKATWTANKYTIKFNGNNSTSGSTANKECTRDSDCTLPKNGFSRTGYTFAGWATSANGSVTYTNEQTIKNAGCSGTVTLYAKWTAKNHNICFNGNGATGGTMNCMSCTYDKNCKLTKNAFIRQYTVSFNPNTGTISANGVNVTAYSITTAYTFNNWKNPNNTTTYNDEATVKNLIAEGTINLLAQWNQKAITLPTATKECYTLEGWYNGSTKTGNAGASYTPTAKSTLTAHWNANNYTIKFDGNGSTSGSTANKSCTYGQNCTLPTNGFKKTGYTFAGWATSATGAVVYTNGKTATNIGCSGTVTLYAKWTPNTYKITFNGNGATGGTTTQAKCTYDQYCSLTKNNFSKPGYSFNGWAKTSTGTKEYNDAANVKNLIAEGNITLYAKWNGNAYTIAFDGNGATGGTTGSIACTHGVDCTLPENKFIKQYTVTFNPDGGKFKINGTTLNSFSSVSAYEWTKWKNPNNTTTYDKGQKVKDITTSDKITLLAQWKTPTAITLPNVEKDCHAFDGWYDSTTKLGTTYTPTANKTLTAHWTPNTYTISFNGNGATGGSTANKSCTYNQNCTLSSNGFTKLGYGFEGWSTTPNGSVTYTNEQTIKNLGCSGTVTLYAKWILKTNTVTLNNQNATTPGTTSVTATYGNAMPKITIPKRTGYKFGGYYTEKSGNGIQYYTATGTSARNWDLTTNTTLYAKWTVHTCTITFSPDGGKFNLSEANAGRYTQEVNYNKTFTLRNANNFFHATKDGYYFDVNSAWTNGTKTFAQGNTNTEYLATDVCPNLENDNQAITLKVNWKPYTCTITYNANGGKFNLSEANAGKYTQEVKYNNTLALRNVNNFYHATKTGYYFETNKSWTNGTKTFAQENTGSRYKATDICPNLANGNESVTLKVNWLDDTPTITISPNGGSISAYTKVTITCEAKHKITKFTTLDDTGDSGSKYGTDTNTKRQRRITLISCGSRAVSGYCETEYGAKKQVNKAFTIACSSGGGGSSGGGSSGGGSSGGSNCKTSHYSVGHSYGGSPCAPYAGRCTTSGSNTGVICSCTVCS